MSIPERVTVSCPKCGKQFQTTIFASLNTDFSPDVAETIINGKRFNAPCPSCGFDAHLEYDMLYHDLKHQAMIWVIHTNNPDYEKKVADTRKTNLLSYKFTRIVPDMNALREKVSCLEANRDDRVVEICKELLKENLLEQQPDFCFRNAFYTYAQGKETIYFYDNSGDSVSCCLEDDIYNTALGVVKKTLSQMDASPYQIIDRSWALDFLNNALIEDEDASSSVETAVLLSNTTSEDRLDEPQIRFCRKCGAKLLSDSIFCSYCGADVLGHNGLDTTRKKTEHNVHVSKSLEMASTTEKVSATVHNRAAQKYRKSKGRSPKNKTATVIIVVVVLLLASLVGLFYYSKSIMQNIEITNLLQKEITSTIDLQVEGRYHVFFKAESALVDKVMGFQEIKWKTSNDSVVSICSISENHIYLIANKAGSATITVLVNGIEMDSVKVVVQPKSETGGRLSELYEILGETPPTSAPLVRPQNGEIIFLRFETLSLDTAPLEVKTSGTSDYFIKLRYYSTGLEVMSFYVHGGCSVEIEVPLGNYEITYACGSDWYGSEGLFGEDTSCYKADSPFSFYEEDGTVNGWTVTLYPVVNGNLDTDIIDMSEF